MIRDIAARNALLSGHYGAQKGAASPASFQFAVFAGDPALDGVELTGGGYGRVTLANDGTVFPTPAGGEVTFTVNLPLTGEPVGVPSHWILFWPDGTTGDATAELGDQLLYTVAGTYALTVTIQVEDLY